MEEPQQLSESQKPSRPITRWHANQVAVTHHTPLDITEEKQKILHSLDFATLNNVLLARSGYHLEAFTQQDVPRPVSKRKDPDPDDPTQAKDVPVTSTYIDITEQPP